MWVFYKFVENSLWVNTLVNSWIGRYSLSRYLLCTCFKIMENIRESIDFQHMLMVYVFTGRAFLALFLNAFLNISLTFSNCKNFKFACFLGWSWGWGWETVILKCPRFTEICPFKLYIEITCMKSPTFLKQTLNGFDFIGQIFTPIIFWYT